MPAHVRESCRLAKLFVVAASLLSGCFVQHVAADDTPAAAEPVSYYRQIRPIFQEHCQGCHQPSKQGGDYVMTEFARLLAGGETGDAAIVPGKPDESHLIAQITPENGSAEMPKEQPPLSDAQIQLIRQWIAEGAQDDTPMSARPQYDMDHPPVYSAPPVITSVDFSRDGQWLAVSGYHEVVLFSADGSQRIARLVGLSERIESAVFSPDSTWLAVTGGSPGRMGEVQIWNVANRELKLSKTVGYDTCYGASWSGDGKLVAFGCPDNSVRAIDVETGEQKLFCGAHDDWVLDTVFSKNSDHLVTVSRDQSMKLIHVATQRFIDNITSITPGALKGGLASVDRHPTEDQLLVGGADGIPKIYRMFREQARKIGDDFNLIRAFPGMPGRVFAVAFSPDASRIVAGSSLNSAGMVRIYNTADAKIIAQLDVDSGGIYAVAFSADGKVVAAGGYDGHVMLLNADDGTVLREFYPVDLQPVAAVSSK